MYFKNFPTMIYDVSINNKDVAIAIKDITRNIRFRRDILANISVYDEYDIVDNESPEIIAEKAYGNPNYHWIIMLANDRYDYINDFPLSTVDLEKYISLKYGSSHIYDTHHYTKNGFVVDSDVVGAYSVSNYDYETSINESKRRIRIIPKELIDRILSDYRELM